ncbi:MAG TPA: hypothetical protein V6C65_04075 [Allocoleopsis sp.]
MVAINNSTNAALTKILMDAGLVRKTGDLAGCEPVTFPGMYSGVYNDRTYWYYASISSKNLARADEFAKSDELLAAEARYIEMFKEVYQQKFGREFLSGLPQNLFWDEQADRQRESFIRQGLLPQEEQYVFGVLGINSFLVDLLG